jgi:hypothetical protein
VTVVEGLEEPLSVELELEDESVAPVESEDGAVLVVVVAGSVEVGAVVVAVVLAGSVEVGAVVVVGSVEVVVVGE